MHVVMTLCGMAVMVVPTVFWCLVSGGWGNAKEARLQSTNGCCHHFHTALSAHLTISRSHATALFVYSDSDYASAVIGQHLVHVDGVDDVKMHGTSPDPRASFCTILTVHVCGMIWITEE